MRCGESGLERERERKKMEGDIAAALSDDEDDGEIERCDLLFWQRERRLECL